MIITHEIYCNKTLKYLYPQLGTYGKTFIKELQETQNILAVGYVDWIYKKVKRIEHKGMLFILIDKNGKFDSKKERYVNLQKSKANFNSFLGYIREHKSYVDDYLFDFKLRHHHMIVIRLPDRFEKSYEPFLNGEYSKMYTEEEVAEMGFNKAKGVFNKSEDYKKVFLDKINQEFNCTLRLEDLGDRELELPPNIKEETFNFKQ